MNDSQKQVVCKLLAKHARKYNNKRSSQWKTDGVKKAVKDINKHMKCFLIHSSCRRYCLKEDIKVCAKIVNIAMTKLEHFKKGVYREKIFLKNIVRSGVMQICRNLELYNSKRL